MPLNSYQALAEFRYQIRLFLHYSETAARAAGIEPQQHQLLLAVKGFADPGEGPSVGYLADRLQIKHHSTVELIDRMEQRRVVRRRAGADDKRQMIIELTKTGEKLLERLSKEHMSEISNTGPALIAALQRLVPSEEAAKEARR